MFLYSSSNTSINVTSSYPITTANHTQVLTLIHRVTCSLSDIELCVVACSGKEEESGKSESASELGSEGRSSGSGTSYDSMIRKGTNKKSTLKNEKEREKGNGIEVESEDDDTADRDGDYDGEKGKGKGEGGVDEGYSKINSHQNGWDGGVRRNGSSSFSFSAAKVKFISLT